MVLNTVEEALDYLERASGQALDTAPKIEFNDELKTLQIEIDGPLFDGDLTGELARGLAQFQDEIYRATLFALTGLEGRAAKLTIAQKEAVEIVFDVESGCTLINIDLGKFGEGLAGVLAGMSAADITLLTVSVVAVLAVGWIGTKWVVEHYKAQTAKAADAAETERLKTVADSHVALAERIGNLVKSDRRVERFADASANGIREIATRARGATSVKVGRIELDQDEIAAMKRRAPRSIAEPIESIGHFAVVHASGKTTPFKLTLSGQDFPAEFDVDFDDTEFSKEEVDAVWEALKTRSTVELQVNAVRIGDKVKGAVLTDILPL